MYITQDSRANITSVLEGQDDRLTFLECFLVVLYFDALQIPGCVSLSNDGKKKYNIMTFNFYSVIFFGGGGVKNWKDHNEKKNT